MQNIQKKEHIQADGRIRRWGPVPEMDGRYLRVVLLPDDVVESRDLDENTVIDLDAEGHICALTMEHAKDRTDVPHFTFEEVAA